MAYSLTQIALIAPLKLSPEPLGLAADVLARQLYGLPRACAKGTAEIRQLVSISIFYSNRSVSCIGIIVNIFVIKSLHQSACFVYAKEVQRWIYHVVPEGIKTIKENNVHAISVGNRELERDLLTNLASV